MTRRLSEIAVSLQKHVLSRRHLVEPRAQYTSESLMTTEPDPGTLARLVHSSSPIGDQPGRSGRLIGGHVHERAPAGQSGQPRGQGALYEDAPTHVRLSAFPVHQVVYS